MPSKQAPQKSPPSTHLRINEKKWTKPLMDAGWTVIPTTIIEEQKALGLDSVDLNILLHLLSYWWTKDDAPRPAKKTIASALNLDPRTIQRHIARMEKDGLIYREERRIYGTGSRPNRYHFTGLINKAIPLAQKKLKERKRRETSKQLTVKA